MLGEHDRTGELLQRLRHVTQGCTLPDGACASYTALYAGLEYIEADTHLHVHKENNALLPAVLAPDAASSAAVGATTLIVSC